MASFTENIRSRSLRSSDRRIPVRTTRRDSVMPPIPALAMMTATFSLSPPLERRRNSSRILSANRLCFTVRGSTISPPPNNKPVPGYGSQRGIEDKLGETLPTGFQFISVQKDQPRHDLACACMKTDEGAVFRFPSGAGKMAIDTIKALRRDQGIGPGKNISPLDDRPVYPLKVDGCPLPRFGALHDPVMDLNSPHSGP